jgi:hypothetical protein
MTDKFKLKSLIFFSLLYVSTTSGQNIFISVDSLSGSSSTFLSDKIVIGEMHEVIGNYNAYQKIVQSLDFQKSYKLIIERGLSFSYLINEFLTGSDTSIIDKINFQSEHEKIFYMNIYSINKKLADNNKITTIGIDLEYQSQFAQTLTAIKYYLPKTHFQISIQQLTKISSDSLKSIRTKVQDIFTLIDTTKFENNKYDNIVKDILSNFTNTIKISGSSYFTWGRQREKYLLKNFQNRVKDIECFCFIIGVAHLPNNKLYPAFTKKLDKKTTSGFNYIYPIYFNHISNEYIDKKYYCEQSNDPLKSNKTLFNYFDNKKGYWLMKDKDINYLIISN